MRLSRSSIFVMVLLALVAAEAMLLLEFTRQWGWQALLGQQFACAVLGVAVMIVGLRRYGAAILERLDSENPFDWRLTSGVILLFAGFLLVIPGLVTDAAGLALVFPPVRYCLALWLTAGGESSYPRALPPQP
jgi:UPF0716 protein FxsA